MAEGLQLLGRIAKPRLPRRGHVKRPAAQIDRPAGGGGDAGAFQGVPGHMQRRIKPEQPPRHRALRRPGGTGRAGGRFQTGQHEGLVLGAPAHAQKHRPPGGIGQIETKPPGPRSGGQEPAQIRAILGVEPRGKGLQRQRDRPGAAAKHNLRPQRTGLDVPWHLCGAS